LRHLRIANCPNCIYCRCFSEVTNFRANAPLVLSRKFRDRVKRVTRPHKVWSVSPKKRLLGNIVCSSSLFYLLSSVICVGGYDQNADSTNAQIGDLVWGPAVLALGAVGVVHGWVWVWGIMHRKWASPLRALLIGVTSMILGFLALGWGLRHTDPALSGNLIPFYEPILVPFAPEYRKNRCDAPSRLSLSRIRERAPARPPTFFHGKALLARWRGR
jgi:hypothetical protein